jgi:hypothetical protein
VRHLLLVLVRFSAGSLACLATASCTPPSTLKPVTDSDGVIDDSKQLPVPVSANTVYHGDGVPDTVLRPQTRAHAVRRTLTLEDDSVGALIVVVRTAEPAFVRVAFVKAQNDTTIRADSLGIIRLRGRIGRDSVDVRGLALFPEPIAFTRRAGFEDTVHVFLRSRCSGR